MTVERDRRLRAVTERLSAAGVWDPEGDAARLVCRFFGPEDQAAAEAELEMAVGERERRVPIEHIVGSAFIDGAPFVVGSGAFIPRAESGPVIDIAADRGVLPEGGTVVDLCAGVGTLGLAIARRRPDARVVLVERDEVPVRYLHRNADRLTSGSLLTIVDADLLQLDVTTLGTADVVVANPPYVPPGLVLLPEWSEHQPKDALYGGEDGLVLVRRVIEIARDVLREGGRVVLEHDRAQPDVVRALLTQAGFTDVRAGVDGAGETRITQARTGR